MATSTQQLETNIVATVSTAEAVLAHFEQSLLAAGFAEGAQSYVRLTDTLIGQRLWAETSGMAGDARFTAVALHARAIHALLLPYTEAFERLAALAAPRLLGDADTSESPLAPPEAVGADFDHDPLTLRVLEALDAATRPRSTTALRAALGVTKSELLAALDRLFEAALIERHRTSGRELIKRTET
jgi:hypothetical protein